MTTDDGYGRTPHRLPQVSVIIRAHNEATALPFTLRAIRQQRFDGDVEIVVVDSGSTDATRRIAADAGARVVCLDRAYRPGYAVNAGVAASRAPICVLLSAPALPADDLWLARLVGPLGGESDSPAVTFSRHRSLPGACPMEAGFIARVFTESSTTAQFSATGGAFRREVWERCPGNPDIPPTAPDDREWIARVRAAGFQVRYVPDSVVVRSHRLDAAGWFWRVSSDASTEREHVARWGAPSSPTPSGVGLASATVASLLRDRDMAELLRFVLLAPLLMLARSPMAPRLGDRGTRVIDAIGRADRRVFGPQRRWDRAFGRFASTYWALRRSTTGVD
jgi:glycosyltransferase involved in cell wall biosynthesis